MPGGAAIPGEGVSGDGPPGIAGGDIPGGAALASGGCGIAANCRRLAAVVSPSS